MNITDVLNKSKHKKVDLNIFVILCKEKCEENFVQRKM